MEYPHLAYHTTPYHIVSKVKSFKVTLKAVGKTETFLSAANNFFYWPISRGTAVMKNKLVPKREQKGYLATSPLQ